MARGHARSNARGLELTLKALADRIGPEDEALVALARGLADAVDAAPDNAALWREYRATVTALMLVGSDDVDDDTAEFLLSIRTPAVRAEMGDAAKPGAGKSRAANRGGGGAAGSSADAVATVSSRRRRRD